jgi:hypothetical protein
MYRLHSIMSRALQILGVFMAIVTAPMAIMWAMQGQRGDALFAGAVSLAAIAFAALAGWMRKAAKREAETFPPKAR